MPTIQRNKKGMDQRERPKDTKERKPNRWMLGSKGQDMAGVSEVVWYGDCLFSRPLTFTGRCLEILKIPRYINRELFMETLAFFQIICLWRFFFNFCEDLGTPWQYLLFKQKILTLSWLPFFTETKCCYQEVVGTAKNYKQMLHLKGQRLINSRPSLPK